MWYVSIINENFISGTTVLLRVVVVSIVVIVAADVFCVKNLKRCDDKNSSTCRRRVNFKIF